MFQLIETRQNQRIAREWRWSGVSKWLINSRRPLIPAVIEDVPKTASVAQVPNHRCPNCGSDEMTRVWFRSWFRFGSETSAAIPCSRCGILLMLNRRSTASGFAMAGLLLMFFIFALYSADTFALGVLVITGGIAAAVGRYLDAYFLRGIAGYNEQCTKFR